MDVSHSDAWGPPGSSVILSHYSPNLSEAAGLSRTAQRPGAAELGAGQAEQAIRSLVIGCKNWLFSGSPRGATASATREELFRLALFAPSRT
jgi:hypothetical protein